MSSSLSKVSLMKFFMLDWMFWMAELTSCAEAFWVRSFFMRSKFMTVWFRLDESSSTALLDMFSEARLLAMLAGLVRSNSWSCFAARSPRSCCTMLRSALAASAELVSTLDAFSTTSFSICGERSGRAKRASEASTKGRW
jgi:hypothetical protein